MYYKILIVASLWFAIGANVPKSKVLKCAVCESLVGELHSIIAKADQRKVIEVGSFRIGADGSQTRTTIKYAGSETHLGEVLETVCGDFKDFVMGRHKDTNRLEVIKLITEGGAMNPRFGEYELVQDPDLNKGVEYHCQSIVEDFEDELMHYFAKASGDGNFDVENSGNVFCHEVSKICRDANEEL